MEGKHVLLLFSLVGMLHISFCDKTYDIKLVNGEELSRNSHSGVSDSGLAERSISEDKTLNKRRLYDESDERNMDFDYSEKFSDFNAKRKNDFSVAEAEKNYEQHSDVFLRDEERNRYSFGSGFDNSHSDRKRPTQFYQEKMHPRARLDWDRTADSFDMDRQAQLNEGRNPKLRGNSLENTEINNYFNRQPPFHINSRDFKKHGDYGSDKEYVKMHPGYDFSSQITYPAATDFNLENSDSCKADKAIIINFKTECPLSNQSKNRMMRKYLFSKSHLNNINTQPIPSQFIPHNHFYVPSHNAPMYFV